MATTEPPDSNPEHRLPAVLSALSRLQATRPWWFVAIAVLSMIPAAVATLHLGFKPDFSELLPENKESVIEMRRVSKRLAGTGTLSLVVQSDGKTHDALEACVDALVPALEAIGKDYVGAVDHGVRDTQRFFEQNQLLYADLADLKKAHDRIQERYDWEVAKQQGTLLDEEDAPPPISADSIEKELSAHKAPRDKNGPAYPNGYYEGEDGKYAAILVRTPISGDAATKELRRRVEAAVARVNPKRFDPSITVGYTGDIVTGAEEYHRIITDLSEVGVAGVLGVMGSVLLYFARVRIVLTMGGTLMVGLLWTFGLTRFTIGYLNASTGFLVSIIAGNGINYGIIYMARYVEARREQGLSVAEAIRTAHRDSWIPTLASAATAGIAYGSLIVTDFRGFKHFGIIGGYGMFLCWLATYLFTPALLAASEAVWPAFKDTSPNQKRSAGGYIGWAFERISLGSPRAVAIVGVLIGVSSFALCVRYFERDPMEYNMRNVGTDDPKTRGSARQLSGMVDGAVGKIGQEGIAIVTDRVDQVPLLETELQRRYDAAPNDLKPFEKVVSIFSLLPKDQEQKLPLITEMQDRLHRARRRGLILDPDWAKIEPHLIQGEVKPIGIADLPEQVARSFTERDGTRGRIVYIAPKLGFSVWDGQYLMRWADSFRKVTLPNGEVIRGSGRAVINADMIKTIGEDAPKAITIASIGTILVILVAFRGSWLALGVFVPWLLGITGLIAFLDLKQIHLNFLNFVAIPITIGIGAEYAHNVMQRYRIEGATRLRRVVLATGGAVTLCSLTTAIGYLALIFSINRGIRSFGLSAAVGELTCLCAAVLWLPAVLSYFARRSARSASKEA